MGVSPELENGMVLESVGGKSSAACGRSAACRMLIQQTTDLVDPSRRKEGAIIDHETFNSRS
jgi:hypothetical protein